MILQNFQDEIAPSKHKAAKTLVHKLEWQPYGDRVAEDTAKSAYAVKLTRFVKQLLEKSSSSNKQLLKVSQPTCIGLESWCPLQVVSTNTMFGSSERASSCS